MAEDFTGFSSLSRLSPSEYYTSEEGYVVFTEEYHLKRGYCCKNLCKHCPYGYTDKVKKARSKTEHNPNGSTHFDL